MAVVRTATDNAESKVHCKGATVDRDIAVATRFIRGHKFDRRGTDPAGRKERRIRSRTEDTLMYTVVRSYFGKGATELFDVLERNKADL
jgi:hypothetical protein